MAMSVGDAKNAFLALNKKQFEACCAPPDGLVTHLILGIELFRKFIPLKESIELAVMWAIRNDVRQGGSSASGQDWHVLQVVWSQKEWLFLYDSDSITRDSKAGGWRLHIPLHIRAFDHIWHPFRTEQLNNIQWTTTVMISYKKVDSGFCTTCGCKDELWIDSTNQQHCAACWKSFFANIHHSSSESAVVDTNRPV